MLTNVCFNMEHHGLIYYSFLKKNFVEKTLSYVMNTLLTGFKN